MLTNVVIVALIATTNAAVNEYRAEALRARRYRDTGTEQEAPVFSASVINAPYSWALSRDIEETENTATLVLEELPDQTLRPQGNHPVCKSILGIDLDHGRSFFCDVDLIQVAADYDATLREDAVSLSMFFSMFTDKPLVLDIPLFKIPHQYEATEQEQNFKKWAARERVGTTSPMSAQELIDIRHDLWVPVNFTWLNELLTMGITKGPPEIINFEEYVEHIYVTRPLVVSEAVSKAFLDLAYWRKRTDVDGYVPSNTVRPR